MLIIARPAIRKFWERHPDNEQTLPAWYHHHSLRDQFRWLFDRLPQLRHGYHETVCLLVPFGHKKRWTTTRSAREPRSPICASGHLL